MSIEKKSKLYAMQKLMNVLNRGLRQEDYEKPKMFTAAELEQAYKDGAEETTLLNHWISVKDELPSEENGLINTAVLVRGKLYNRENGRYVHDITIYDGKKWEETAYMVEKILEWKPII